MANPADLFETCRTNYNNTNMKLLVSISMFTFLFACGQNSSDESTAEATINGSNDKKELTDESSNSLIGEWYMFEGQEVGEKSDEIFVFGGDGTLKVINKSKRNEGGSYTYNEELKELVVLEPRAGGPRETILSVLFRDQNTVLLEGSYDGEPMKDETEAKPVQFYVSLKRKL